MNEVELAQIIQSLDGVASSVNYLTLMVAVILLGFGGLAILRVIQGASKSSRSFKFSRHRGEDLYSQNKLQNLVEYCHQCLDKYPNDTTASWYLGISYYGMGDYFNAYKTFENLVKLNPHWKHNVQPYLDSIVAAQAGTLDSADKH